VARAKDTARAEARRRHRESLRVEDPELDPLEEAETPEPTVSARPSFRLPDVRTDVVALPSMIRSRPLVLLPFGMLIVAFVLELLRQSGALPVGAVGDVALLYIQLTLPPTALFVFFIGGFLAPRASWLVGGLLGAFDALLITLLVFITPQAQLEGSVSEVAQGLVPLWGIAIMVGILAAAFAAWYRTFLRSSQERARANRMARERQQAAQAKEQAKKDREAARQAARGRS
jgi:hypothetical protein